MGQRLLVIDESLSRRLAAELNKRGRSATSLQELKLLKLKDPELIPELADQLQAEDWILVTGDDAMPGEHGELLRHHAVTVATVAPHDPDTSALTQEQHKRETVHRWAHRIAEQTPGTFRRYSPDRHRKWTPRH